MADFRYPYINYPNRSNSRYRYNNAPAAGVIEIAEPDPVYNDYLPQRYDYMPRNEPLNDPVVVVNRDYLPDNRHRPPTYDEDQPEITELKIRRDLKDNQPTPNHDQHVYDTTPITEIKIKRDIDDNKKLVDFQNPVVDFDETPVKPLLHNPFMDENYKGETPKPSPTVERKLKETPTPRAKPTVYNIRKNKVVNAAINDTPRSKIETKKKSEPTKTNNKNTKKGESFEIPLNDNTNRANVETPIQKRFVTMKLGKSNNKNNNNNNSKPKAENNNGRRPVNVNSAFQPDNNQQYALVLPQNQLDSIQYPVVQYPNVDYPSVIQYPQAQKYMDPTTGYIYEDPNGLTPTQQYMDPTTGYIYNDPNALTQPQAVYQLPAQETKPQTLPQTVINTNYVIIQPKDEKNPQDNSNVLLTNRSQSQSQLQYLQPPEVPQLYQNVPTLPQLYPDGQLYQYPQTMQPVLYQDPQLYQQPIVAQDKPKDVYNITRIVGSPHKSPVPFNQTPGPSKAPKEVNYEIIKRKKPLKTIVHHYFK